MKKRDIEVHVVELTNHRSCVPSLRAPTSGRRPKPALGMHLATLVSQPCSKYP